ncbi:saccharopine dehydrogenase C-terminal domain-containing protein [Haloechinothrix halophila]|uniref:saccharopine dehydrogenase C-terminal domain-containing protein n=1 Tax=Haloechinothrix halophila TaxID=1069073 RepID=UPI00040FE962|nr:saccharopine dehydrogenase C-terminal domain-containing protein [Haloechinothrix halophila]
MTERWIEPSGTVHWVGTGMSTGHSGLTALAEDTDVVLWGRTRERARRRLEMLDVSASVSVRGLDRDDLADSIGPGDVVVSMLPVAHHTELLRTALDNRAHFACTSYTAPEVAELSQRAREVGTVVLTEAGLDPGIDHLMAHVLVTQAREQVGDTADRVALTSYCGGIPAHPGEFRYQFSWAPVGVLRALTTPARYIHGGQVRVAERPWEATETYTVGGEAFEVYPNRDSIGFTSQYGLPPEWTVETFVRGTLRPSGWKRAWGPVFDVVASGADDRIVALAEDLAERYPTTPEDRDRVVLAVTLEVEHADVRWEGCYTLDVAGDHTDTAMARCVSSSLASGLRSVVKSRWQPGLHRATADPSEANEWLTSLAGHDLPMTYHSSEKGRRDVRDD